MASPKPRAWSREQFIEHYKAVAANQDAPLFARNHAEQALKGFGVLTPAEIEERKRIAAELELVRERMKPFAKQDEELADRINP